MKNTINNNPLFMLGKKVVMLIILLTCFGCEKFVEIDQLETQILAEQVFENDAMANSAIVGLYKNTRDMLGSYLVQNNSIYSNDIVSYSNALSNTYYTLNIQSNDTSLPWDAEYSMIYGANNAIEKLSGSNSLPQNVKKQYVAEAKFLRALAYFYLVNIFGDVPMVLSTNVNDNKVIARSAVSTVYAQILADLKEAKPDLPDDYSHASNERVRANKSVASALLARVYLFQKDYNNAELEAGSVITSGKYSLLTSATGIFNKNNSEAIFQLANNPGENNGLSLSFIYSGTPLYVCSPALLNTFEAGDMRKSTWIKTTTNSGQPVSIPFKFTTTDVNPPEYATEIRLAEMYLIRAEARNYRNDFQGCVNDINLLRLQHGRLTTPLPAPIDQSVGLALVLHERQVEFFTENCNRFFDLKRTGKWASTMQSEKPSYWKVTSDLYPIPLSDMQRNPNLKQNPGYE